MVPPEGALDFTGARIERQPACRAPATAPCRREFRQIPPPDSGLLLRSGLRLRRGGRNAVLRTFGPWHNIQNPPIRRSRAGAACQATPTSPPQRRHTPEVWRAPAAAREHRLPGTNTVTTT